MRRMLLSIPALVLACATSSPSEQKSDTRKAQDEAQQQYQNAASAQKRATEEQQKAEQTEQDLTKAQKGLADAKAKNEGQHEKAEQAQRDAGQLGRDSQQRSALMQEQATLLQELGTRQGKQTQQGNQQAWMQTRSIRGAVAALSPTSLTVRSEDRGDVRLEVSESTAIKLDGRTASMKELRAGNDVRASYGLVDGRAMAVRLDITSSSGSGDASRSNDASAITPK